jgi:hypothetical protein
MDWARLEMRSQLYHRVNRMRKKANLILGLISILLIAAAPVMTQTPTSSTATPIPPTNVVSGRIVNHSRGGSVPAKLDLVLHAWDQKSNEKLMRDGKSNPDGTFRFEDVPIEPDLSYSVMAVYDGVTYFSKSVMAKAQPLTNIEIPIYETTTDTSNVQIERTVIMFVYTLSGLEVAEVYNAATTGDRAVKDVLKLTAEQSATLQFSLPANAFNVAFDPTHKNEFVRTSSGYAYAGALLPGAPANRIAIRYVLPYTPGMNYTLTAEYPLQDVSFWIARDAGLTLTGDGLTDGGIQKIGNEWQFTVLERGALQAGERAVVTLTGQPKVSNIGQPINSPPSADTIGVPEAVLGVAGILLALGLIVFGLRWLRRPEPTAGKGIWNRTDC